MATKLFQILIKVHILDILNSKSLTVLSHIMTLNMVNGLNYAPDKQPPFSYYLHLTKKIFQWKNHNHYSIRVSIICRVQIY